MYVYIWAMAISPCREPRKSCQNLISLENMGNHANNTIFLGGPMIFSEICPKSHCFPDWVWGDVSVLYVEVREFGIFQILKFLRFLKLLKISPKWSWSHDHLGQPAKTCPIHDPRWGKKWAFCEIIGNTWQETGFFWKTWEIMQIIQSFLATNDF